MARSATPSAALRRVRTVLRDTFGLSRLRPGQAAVIERVLAGEPTLAVMPTGAGKSLCYQLPALLLEGRTIVVSPLIALMKDQCESLRELGIAAVQVNSATDNEESSAAEQAVADGSARIVMTTPERLADPAFLERCCGIRSACWPSTRPTASRSGATTSVRPSWRSPTCCRAWAGRWCWR